jgi:hypothetical protein
MYGALWAPTSSSCGGLVAFVHLLTPGRSMERPLATEITAAHGREAILAEGRTNGGAQLVF